MILYVAMIDDRHGDPEAFTFSTAEAAITYARTQAQLLARHEDGFEEEEPPEGWLYYARYSGEGDSVWVVETELLG